MNVAELGRAYVAVLAAELIADRSIFTVGALATQFRTGAVIVGLTLACLAKSFVAVMFGQVLKTVPALVLSILSAATLVWGGIILLRRAARTARDPAVTRLADRDTGAGIATTFAAVFFAEWGDIGQITTALIASHSADPYAVWLGSASGLITKGIVATAIVASLRRVLPIRPMIRVGAAACFAMAVLTLWRIEL